MVLSRFPALSPKIIPGVFPQPKGSTYDLHFTIKKTSSQADIHLPRSRREEEGGMGLMPKTILLQTPNCCFYSTQTLTLYSTKSGPLGGKGT